MTTPRALAPPTMRGREQHSHMDTIPPTHLSLTRGVHTLDDVPTHIQPTHDDLSLLLLLPYPQPNPTHPSTHTATPQAKKKRWAATAAPRGRRSGKW